jgi:hypothetical protein
MVWYESVNSQTTTSTMEWRGNEISATKRIYNKSTYSQEVDRQINWSWVTSKATFHWAFPGLKLGGWWEVGSSSLHISQLMPVFITLEDIISHVSNKDQDDGMPPHHGIHSRSMVYLWCLVRLWTTMITQKDTPTPLELKLPCEFQWRSFFDP